MKNRSLPGGMLLLLSVLTACGHPNPGSLAYALMGPEVSDKRVADCRVSDRGVDWLEVSCDGYDFARAMRALRKRYEPEGKRPLTLGCRMSATDIRSGESVCLRRRVDIVPIRLR